jgi:hypothetical protein
VDAFRKDGIPVAIPAAVHEHYKSAAISKSFTLSPDDRFADLFSAEDDDLGDNTNSLLQQLGMKLPPEYKRREWGGQLVTLRDMVLWLDWMRQHQPAKS